MKWSNSVANIFIDLGAYDGDTVEQFFNWSKLIEHHADSFKIYAFEPNPNVNRGVEKLAERKVNVTFSNKAAWINDGEIEFAVDSSNTPLGSTVEDSKHNIWDNNEHITVECFDFSEWIKQFKDDYVIVKMDIEGAEFPILEKMLQDKTVKYMDKLLCEFHPNKVARYTSDDKADLIKRLSKYTEVIEWH